MDLRNVGGFAYVAILCGAVQAQECVPYWANIPRLPPTGWTIDLPVYDDGFGPSVYSYGVFPPETTWRVAKWTGRSWSPLSYGFPTGDLFAYAVLDAGGGPKLHARRGNSGTFENFRWDGVSWEMLPAAFGSAPLVYGMHSHNDGNGSKIYGFRDVQDPFVRRVVVRWDGGSWTIIGNTASGLSLYTLATHDDGTGPALYVCGEFSSMNGVPARKIARWKGQSWSAVGGGLSQGPRAMVSLDLGTGPRLYTLGGELGANNEWLVMVWDGQSWTTIGGASAPTGTLFTCQAMVAYDDGTGPGLVVAGNMPFMGGVLVKGMARWDGQTWSAMGAGIRTPTGGLAFERLAVCPDARGPSLFAAGANNGFGGGDLGGIAHWVGCPNCYANCDLSGAEPVLNVVDFVCFINKFVARDPYANCTVDAAIDVLDFSCFLEKYARGCP